ncbi:DUF5131 family protein [Mycobacterium sp. C3-094]
MSATTAIEWTDRTWNPLSGCTKVSPGCNNCYAETIARRFAGTKAYPNGFDVTLRPERLNEPLRWRKPAMVFVNSMSDLFHDDVSDDYIAQVFGVMAASPRHTFQVLTKRHGRMRSLLNSYTFWMSVCYYERKIALAQGFTGDGPHIGVNNPLPNVWLGVSVENQRWADIRIPALLGTPAAVRFISAEPLLGHIDLYRHLVGLQSKMLHWVIVGGESGHRARPMNPRWVRGLRDQCTTADVAFFFKQWGEWGPAPWSVTPQQPGEFTLDYKRRAEADGASHAFTGGLYNDLDGYVIEHFMELSHRPWSVERAPDAPSMAEGMKRWGKKAAGRELDGRTWDQYPEAVTV